MVDNEVTYVQGAELCFGNAGNCEADHLILNVGICYSSLESCVRVFIVTFGVDFPPTDKCLNSIIVLFRVIRIHFKRKALRSRIRTACKAGRF